ncbi:Protein TPX2 [Apostasia shenzhenica]|uniref:Protein TPX2 n=1 Tax=Apostasia shenzhenica TaxID=1088818 RepID=A0A2I0ADU1_9ASPA|nr:Protein TPX2 [Apostasia shenzhenica]
MSTPVKTPRHSRCKSFDSNKASENLQPNILIPTPTKKWIQSPASKSASKSRNAAGGLISPPLPPPQRERKFVVAKKNNSKSRENDFDPKKRQEAAYEALRASQEEFFKNDIVPVLKTEQVRNGEEKLEVDSGSRALDGGSKERKNRSWAMEEALNSIPEPGSGRVKHLVKAFESLLSISEGEESAKNENRKTILMDWVMPGLLPKAVESDDLSSSPSVLSSVKSFSFGGCERDSRLCSSWDSFDSNFDSSRKNWNKRLKVTSQQPFKLRTEQRGRAKEQMFVKKVTEMLKEEEKRRIPIAQGLPWTTDEPECLIKPPVKDCTEPIDIILHSDVRAIERADFDNYLEKEEEIKRLRRKLIPRAQLMPYFDRPFIPKR